MPIVYEHWRPDTNECFYVGMSVLDETGALARANNFARPYNKYHTNIVRKLVSNGLEPFAVIVETYADPESAKAREKMQIAYRRATIGNRLTNVTNGGDGGPILFGKDNPMSRPDVRRKAFLYLKSENHHAKKPEFKRKASLRIRGNKNPMNRPDVREKVLSAKNVERKMSALKKWRKSDAAKEKHFEISKKLIESGERRGENNANSKLTAKQVARIREIFDGKKLKLVEVARLFGVSIASIKRIKYGKAWR